MYSWLLGDHELVTAEYVLGYYRRKRLFIDHWSLIIQKYHKPQALTACPKAPSEMKGRHDNHFTDLNYAETRKRNAGLSVT